MASRGLSGAGQKDVAERDAADWIKVEQAKLPPLKYAIGDWFTIYPDGGKKDIVLTGIADNDVFYVYPDEPGQDQVFMDRGAFEQSLRTGHIRETQPREAVQTIASYRNDDEAIVIQRYPNGQFYTHYGYDEQNRFSMATAGGFPSFEEAEAALRSHRPNAEKVMEGPEEVRGEPVLGTEAAQTPRDEAHDEAQGMPSLPPRKMGIKALPNRKKRLGNAPASTESSYQVGDTIYLEDTAYIVEDVGLFDVRLRDPSLAYPILRSESRKTLSGFSGRTPETARFCPVPR